MALFDFVADAELRSSLISDYRELHNSLDSSSWKSVHVMAGSMIETILVDYLLSINYQDPNGKDILELSLGQLISACKNQGILTQRAQDLSNVVRDYRNLIHPGRVKRLQETIDGQGAKVAEALVEIIMREIEKKRTETYGLTAEQLLSRLEADPSRIVIFEDMLANVNSREKKKLLLEIIPHRHFEREMMHELEYADSLSWDVPSLDQSSLEKAFRITFDSVSNDVKSLVVSNFVRMITEESEEKRLSYECAFFQAHDLAYCLPEEITMVKKHITAVLRQHPARVLPVLKGMGRFLSTSTELTEFISVLMRLMQTSRKEDVINYLRYEMFMTNPDTAGITIVSLIKLWIVAFDEHDESHYADDLRALVTLYELDDALPF